MMTTLQHNYFADAHLLWLVFNNGSLLRGVTLKTATFHPVLCFFTVLSAQHFPSCQVAKCGQQPSFNQKGFIESP